MRRILHFINLIAVITLISFTDNHCIAQNIYANGSIDKDSIFAGQTFNYKLDVRMPSDYIVDWSEIKDTLSKNIDIVKRSDISMTPINNSNDVILSQLLTMTTFDTGYVEIPKISLKYSKSTNDTSTYACFTEYMDIYVQAVPIDTTMAYKPIKMPIKQNITIEETIPYVGGAIVLAALILLVLYLIRKFNKKEETEEVEIKPQIPAIVTARERLSQLKEATLWQSGKIKEYYTDLTDIAREYLKGQFNIDATEMTSDEILDEVRKLQLDNSTFSKLQNTLTTADLVKFAKANPSTAQNESSFSDINSFVEDSYVFHQEMEKKKAEEAKANKYDFEKETNENQEMEETK
ncbi:MAG: hypothetical protein IKU01_01480 [Bacteroidales bacterium]|nr:hypothetical protein [Bacteroidales bacterium]